MALSPLSVNPAVISLSSSLSLMEIICMPKTFSMIIFLALSLLGYKLSGHKKWLLLFISIAMYEISGNIICGTDNFIGSPLSVCNKSINLIILLGAEFLFGGSMAFMIMQEVKKRVIKINNIKKSDN